MTADNPARVEDGVIPSRADDEGPLNPSNGFRQPCRANCKACVKRMKVSRTLVRSLVVCATRDDTLTFPLPGLSTVPYLPFTKLPGRRFWSSGAEPAAFPRPFSSEERNSLNRFLSIAFMNAS
jgi:hypothetical protein